MEQVKGDTQIDIDIRSLLYFLYRKIKYIVLSFFIVAILFALYSIFFVDPVYQSSTKVYVLQSESGNEMTYSDVQLATQLTKDYEELIRSRSVTDEVIYDLNLNLSNEDLAEMITVTALKDTRILEIKVDNTDPYLAKDIANCVRNVAAQKIVDIMNVHAINTVEEANFPTSPISPNIKKNIIFGGMVGAIGATIILVIIFILDDKVKSTEDIANYIDLPVLGIIPNDTEEKNKNTSKVKKHKKHRKNKS